MSQFTRCEKCQGMADLFPWGYRCRDCDYTHYAGSAEEQAKLAIDPPKERVVRTEPGGQRRTTGADSAAAQAVNRAKDQANKMLPLLKRYPPFLLAMVGVTVLYPVGVFFLSFAVLKYSMATMPQFGGEYLMDSGTLISPGQMLLANLFVYFSLGFCPYVFSMILFLLLHFIQQSSSRSS